MNKKIIIFLFSFFLITSCNQKAEKFQPPSENSDSLDQYFNFANSDSLSSNIKYDYNNKIIKILARKKNDSLNRVNYFKAANRYFNMHALKEYKITTEKIIDNSVKSKDSVSLAKAYSYLADYYGSAFFADSAFFYNDAAAKIYIRLHDKINTAKSLLNKAVLQHNESDFTGCEKTVFEALKKLRGTNENEMIYQAYNLLGIIFGELTEYDLSKKYYSLALEIVDKGQINSEYQLKATTLNNLGILYSNQSKDERAIGFYKTGLIQKNLKKDRPAIYAMLTDNFAYSKFKKGDYAGLPELYYDALSIRDSLELIPGIVLNKIHISEFFAFRKDSVRAFQFAKEAYKLAENNGEKRDVLTTLKQLANVDPKNALKYSTEYFTINDSLQSAERKMRNKFARIEFETEELTIEKDKLVEQRKTLIYIGLGIILIGVFIFVIRFQAAKNRELRLVQEQQKANEEIYQLMISQQNKIEEVRQSEKKRIAQELHDGVLGKLFGTRMNLGILNSKIDDQAISDRVGYIDELKTLEQEIREISHDLNSEKTAVFNNFVVMVTAFFESQRNVCKAAITFSIDPGIEWNTIENMAKINFYRILQEAFQNINKHANAKNVAVTFGKTESQILLYIEDDGVGFVYSRKKKGIGLLNMSSRIVNSGGMMLIETNPGNGTLLKFELPLNQIQTLNLVPK